LVIAELSIAEFILYFL